MSGSLSHRLSGGRFDQANESQNGSGPPNAPAEPGRPSGRNDLNAIKARLQRQVIAELGAEADLNTSQGRRQVEALLNELVEAEGLPLPRVERTRLLEAVIAEV